MTVNTVIRDASAGGDGLRTVKCIRIPALVITACILFWSGFACADGATPSLEEMWKIIQQQQAEIKLLKDQNARLLERAEARSTEDRTPSADTLATAGPEDKPYEQTSQTDMSETVAGTRLDLYGAVMLDMGHQFNQSDPDWFDVVRPTKLPSYKDEFGADGNFFSGVRQSRFGVKSWTPTRLGELHTIFEFELFGVGADAGQTTFRLRHAWGELGQFGAGQTWSPFMDPDVFPNSIEYWGPSGMVFFRNVQARWTPWKEGGSNFMMALERPGASGDQGKYDENPGLEGVRGRFPLPDLSAHFRYQQDWGHVQVAGILRKIEWEDLNDDQYDLSGSATGWGINLSTNLNLGRHVFRGSLLYGEGVQNYMNDATVDIGIRDNFQNPLKPVVGTALPVLGIVAFLDLNWNERWSSTVGYSLLDMDNSDGQSPDAFNKGQYALANILYHPTTSMLMGPELQWAKRDNYLDGFSSDDFRIQFSMKYSFSKTFGGN
jgi:hypothetical protein